MSDHSEEYTVLLKDFFSSRVALVMGFSWSLEWLLLQTSARILYLTLVSSSSLRTQMTRSSGHNKTIFLLSKELLLQLDLQESVSSLSIDCPRQWQKVKSKQARYKNQHTYFWFSFLAVMKYSRFLQLVQICTGLAIPLRKCLHSSSVQIIASISLSWILQFLSTGDKDLLQNATNLYLLSIIDCWNKTVPIAKLELSTLIQKGSKS